MNFFNDDPFENLFDEFFGRGNSPFNDSNKRNLIDGEADQRKIGLSEFKDKVFLTFELSDRKSTRLNSSHTEYLVCRLLLEKKKITIKSIFS